MIEKTLYLEGIDPVIIYGTNNSNLNKIKIIFPKLKIIARGEEVKVIGDTNEIMRFERKLEQFILRGHDQNNLTDDDIDDIFLSDALIDPEVRKVPDDVLIYGNHGKIVKARTVNQQKLVKEYELNDLLFAIGPAGTGKTYTAIALAVRALRNKEIRRIVLTRPAVEAGENLGYLPGDMKEKLDPYLRPLYDALRDMIPPKKLASYIEDGTIEIAPLAYMRGRTLGDAFVILDEGQNTTVNQLKMFLTRMGTNARFIVTGDITQIDLPQKHNSGLIKALDLLKNIKGVSVVYFDARDIVRHRLVKFIVHAYEQQFKNNNAETKS
ncbi:MAG: PhoH family protein [Bacteroidales bacterium]|nr:PhoH family protein [Bacteroidales bacterium]